MKPIIILSTWHNTSEDENYCIGSIYISEYGVPIICASSRDAGCYDEWELSCFYREFTYVDSYGDGEDCDDSGGIEYG